jgi:hypothetical protein
MIHKFISYVLRIERGFDYSMMSIGRLQFVNEAVLKLAEIVNDDLFVSEGVGSLNFNFGMNCVILFLKS